MPTSSPALSNKKTSPEINISRNGRPPPSTTVDALFTTQQVHLHTELDQANQVPCSVKMRSKAEDKHLEKGAKVENNSDQIKPADCPSSEQDETMPGRHSHR